MNLVRFMGADELFKYLRGGTLKNNTDWRREAASTSKGFCFFPADPPPEDRLHYLSGVVDFSYVAEFEPRGPICVTMGTGMYRDPREPLPLSIWECFNTPVKMIPVEEYSIAEYSRKTLKLKRYGKIEIKPGARWAIRWCGDQQKN